MSRRSPPYEPDPNSQQARWTAAIAGLVEIEEDWQPQHERLKPTYTFAESKAWRIKLPDGRLAWARTWGIVVKYYLPPDVADECHLRQAAKLGRGMAWAKSQIGRNAGWLKDGLRDAILRASPERVKQLEYEIARLH
ncbi:MAG: hypothetical protein V4719_20475 [Planctomycetota bacterium]